MFSFAPIIFVAVSIVNLFLDEINAAEQLYQRLESIVGPGITDLVRQTVSTLANEPSSTSIVISVISFLALLYTASGLFYQLQFSLNTIWGVPSFQKGSAITFIRQRLLAFVLVIGIGLLWVLVIFLNFFVAWFGSFLVRLLGISGDGILTARLVVPILLVFVIALFYKILPGTKVAWRDVWLGAVIASTFILAVVFLAGLFFQLSSFNSALQATGAFTVLLVGFYYIAQIFLLGAVCCRVYAGLYGSRRPELKPKNNGGRDE
jgi:membrane protein